MGLKNDFLEDVELLFESLARTHPKDRTLGNNVIIGVSMLYFSRLFVDSLSLLQLILLKIGLFHTDSCRRVHKTQRFLRKKSAWGLQPTKSGLSRHIFLKISGFLSNQSLWDQELWVSLKWCLKIQRRSPDPPSTKDCVQITCVHKTCVQSF